jgi:hypothetical protein
MVRQIRKQALRVLGCEQSEAYGITGHMMKILRLLRIARVWLQLRRTDRLLTLIMLVGRSIQEVLLEYNLFRAQDQPLVLQITIQ